ncbi:hypothetical protein POF50_013765 [Streptomyces sp. SL13]|uniref:Uncharacterized protein n=1 Tax=Streptantibioticus silvisoli TaxID=2705255 RepID=A0AA90KGC9_9ACTN|nr:hypothetical protein [Streptantibioticus silvisoli]MDI5963846.1 hypothetical protein [Streptantibioticus silvisoli]MDI5970395.1 hypothetical protein [Streptantibioticus silvisoli]
MAGLWVVWADRRRKQAGDLNSLAGYARFREAMAKSHSGGPEA